jgi:hypothetical protein
MSDSAEHAIHYVCQRCTNCCRWPGVVEVNEKEITAIAEFVGMSEEQFIERHTPAPGSPRPVAPRKAGFLM